MRVGWKAATTDQNIASFRFRALRPVEALKTRGHDVELASLDRIDSYDAVVFSKSYRRADHQLARALKDNGKRVIFDLCDNHFYNPYNLASYRSAHAELVEMISLADLIVCSTPALARVLTAESGTTKPVVVIGDATDFVDVPEHMAREETRNLLWYGSHGSPNAPCGMNDLLAIEPLLRKLSRDHDFRLVIASNNRPKFDSLKGYFETPLEYVEWTLDGFPHVLGKADGVVIPLSRNPFVNCKTHNRVSTALAAGIPVVADAIESYREFAAFCTLDDWEVGLREILTDPEAARMRAKPARDYLVRHWSIDQIAALWEAALDLQAASQAVATARDAVAATVESATRSERTPRRYQGALDSQIGTTVSGWVLQPLDSGRALEVVLKIDGEVAARDVAQRRRNDIDSAGGTCGFVLRVPSRYCDGDEHVFEVEADGRWTMERGERRFGLLETPLAAEQGDEMAAAKVLERPPEGDRIATSLALATAALTDNAAELASVALQKRLFADLEQLNAAVDSVRRIAARMILSAADQPEAPQPKIKLRGLGPLDDDDSEPPPRRTLS